MEDELDGAINICGITLGRIKFLLDSTKKKMPATPTQAQGRA